MADLSDKESGEEKRVQVGFSWVDSDASLPTRKASEAELISALQNLNTALGGGTFDVVSVVASPGDIQSIVTFETDGAVQAEKLKQALKLL